MRHILSIIALCLVGFLLASGQGIGGKGGVGGKAGFGGGASAGPVFAAVQGASGANGSATNVPTAAFSSPTTTANAIIAGCTVYGTSVTFGTMTDTAGDTFVGGGAYYDGIDSNTQIFHAYNITGISSNVVTCNFTGGVFENVVAAEEVSGMLTSGALDGTCGSNSCGATNTATTSWVSGTTGTTTQASEIAFGWFSLLNSGTAPVFTPGAGWTSAQAANSGTTYAYLLEYKILSSTGTQQATATLNASGSGVGTVSTYK